ncbi:HNH endonuclease [Hymenobacter guriensis]|uniref:HNH endonuclease n=1 Tax=Hymenobacter guriensis TaxID=2793065 RepID=A0ABS0KVP6_9BACT|nr:HNH endonuclease [Hymenobacter guriensis]MBG8551906.1 HNH endonuclease [Hymenobacter guriensis]
MTWLEYILLALKNLGGSASYADIYAELEKIRPQPFTTEWKATVRRTIEMHSSHSANYALSRPDLFRSVAGLGKGIWALNNFQEAIPTASDIEDPNAQEINTQEPKAPYTSPKPNYSTQIVTRIIRDGALSNELKKLYKYRCQICEHSIILNNAKAYAEGHHIKPLGKPHHGPDIVDNMLIVCPNHHSELDFGARRIRLQDLKLIKHTIMPQFIDYHNRVIYPLK